MTTPADTAAQAQAAMAEAYKLANDKNLAAGEVFQAVVKAKAALDALVAELDRLRDEVRETERVYKEQLVGVVVERAEARAELERVSRERSEATNPAAILDRQLYEGEARADLAAAAGREQRLRDALVDALCEAPTSTANVKEHGRLQRFHERMRELLDAPPPTTHGVQSSYWHDFRAVLEEGQQP